MKSKVYDEDVIEEFGMFDAIIKPITMPIMKGIEVFANMIMEGFKIITDAIGMAFQFVIDLVAGAGLDWLTDFVTFILALFKNVFLVGMFIAKFATELISNPFKAIFSLLKLIFGVVFGVAMFILWIVLELTFVAKGIGYLFAVIAAFCVSWVLMMVYIAIWILWSIIFVILWALNVILGGLLTRFMRCENDPDNWYKGAGFASDNVWRKFLLCFSPCAGGWKKLAGVLCVKDNNSAPHFCPQQEIYGFYRDVERTKNKKYVYDMYVPDARFRYFDEEKKKEIIVETLHHKKKYIGTCNRNMAHWDFAPKTICANLQNMSDMSAENKVKLSELCKQAYCDYDIEDAENGDPVAVFTGKSDIKWCKLLRLPSLEKVPVDEEVVNEFLSCILLLIVGLVVSFVVITMKGYNMVGGTI
jgi:hypothetical protein